ncbi:aldehyde dehydrogenase family protein [Alkalilimnicola ehrlichii]|uniref:Aldehyde dehydrogenase family protein n=1 Tax=Alkalilimnicola ehrlichii TaxID=351052 RepID=A0A3E0WN25_9GAMM|nr:aldehyde dehydrogenase family protein [Alkalilimnicola ehrlichii]RFA27252.1 aldehyde dehydrogenase family protein [Alkalilimnicola ehrlichii]RFA34362.1 aldehyde dehydrogenase family protein [Alkalilimnicola ehrlichii]
MQTYDKVFIDGRWQACGDERAEVFEAATGEVMATIPRAGEAELNQAVEAARRAFPTWSQTPLDERMKYIHKLYEQLKARSDEIATTVAKEVGTPIKLARSIQAGLPIGITGSYLKILPEFPFVETVGNSEIQQVPVGVVGAVTPWNYPLHQIILKVVPALGAGCTVVLKPAEVAPCTAFILAEIFEAIDLPPGVFNLVSGPGRVVGNALIQHPDVDMLSFTGSTNTGRQFFHAAAEDFKRLALELGGKSASIILPDADLEAAVKGTVNNCYLNSGQTCTAHTRMLVPAQLHDQACEIAAAVAERFTPGNPLDEKTRLGPLASASQRDIVQEFIRAGMQEDAKLIAGGPEAPEGLDGGYFVRATVFGNVDPQARIAQEEIFGPVLSIIPYRDEQEAVAIANSTKYGLSGGVWSGDQERAKRVASQMRTGQVAVNGGQFNPFAPFGGFGHSGLGREMGKWGLEEFLEVRSLQL